VRTTPRTLAALIAPSASLLLTAVAFAGVPAGASTTPAQARRLCLGIPASATKALYKGTLRGPLPGTGGATCQFQPAGKGVPHGTLFVQLAVGHGSLWARYSPGAGRLPGIGRRAAYLWSQSSASAPALIAEKGDLDCYATTNGYVDGTTMIYKRSGASAVVSRASAVNWATKLGAVCNAVFSGT
jgi:hypothetical protein